MRTITMRNSIVALLLLSVPVRAAQAPPRDETATPDSIYKEYLVHLRQKKSVVSSVVSQLGKPFARFTDKDYARFMKKVDLNTDEGLWKWSHVTGIPVIALKKNSLLFCFNAHLLRDTDAALRMSYQELIRIKCSYDQATGKLTLTKDGSSLALRELPAPFIHRTAVTSDITHNMDFAEDETNLLVLEPYLLRIRDIPNRKEFIEGIRALPLSIVKLMRGKAIYPNLERGRSYSIGMPVSTDVYPCYAGLQAGVFLDVQSRKGQTVHTLVHEIGHIIDYAVIQGGYGERHRFPYQFPKFRELLNSKRRIFGKQSDPVPQTAHGYISAYAKSNAQESFAEHFRAYILDKDAFRQRAAKELSARHPGLQEKLRFMKQLVEQTPTTMHRLSRKHLAR